MKKVVIVDGDIRLDLNYDIGAESRSSTAFLKRNAGTYTFLPIDTTISSPPAGVWPAKIDFEMTSSGAMDPNLSGDFTATQRASVAFQLVD